MKGLGKSDSAARSKMKASHMQFDFVRAGELRGSKGNEQVVVGCKLEFWVLIRSVTDNFISCVFSCMLFVVMAGNLTKKL